jgi:hypothetical protein
MSKQGYKIIKCTSRTENNMIVTCIPVVENKYIIGIDPYSDDSSKGSLVIYNRKTGEIVNPKQ